MVQGLRPRLFNSLGREQQELTTREPGVVRLYTCGITAYAAPHLGNMRPYVFSDTLRRMLEWKGYAVDQVVNITDVGHAVGDGDAGEDKVEVTARAQQLSVWDVTRKYTQLFFDDIAALNVLPHTHSPRASDYVPQMIEFATVLEQKGVLYQLDSGVYFDTAKSPGYGRLALRDPNNDDNVSRLEAIPGKRQPQDFAVWRAERGDAKRLVHWDSPWGPGVPGWHLECSVMGMELLGEHFDIHTGGVDHREIHHVNEIAQSEAYLDDGRDWVPMWLHNEWVLLDSAKISKSAGSAKVLNDLVEQGFHPMAYRYLLSTAHYRTQLDFTLEAMAGAAAAYRRLLLRAADLRPLPQLSTYDAAAAALSSDAGRAVLDAIDAAISDDLNTARIIAELNTVLRDDALPADDLRVVFAVADRLTGLRLGDLDVAELDRLAAGDAGDVDVARVEQLLAERAAARSAKDFAAADRIRDELGGLGVTVIDTPDGARWEPKR
ncbi:cysteine--tRNA ligase [Jatrophihabitans fulvus]